MITRWFVGCSLVLGLVAAGCGSDSSSGTAGTGGSAGTGGTGGAPFVPPEFGSWVKYEPEGAICSDGSPYAFYVEFSETSDNIVMYFMGGGGCWDYDSCVGGGARGAANPNGLPDDYANVHIEFELGETSLPINVNQVYPLLNNDPAVSPMADWNKVFVPYCTGDVYSGSITNTYEDPDGIEPDEVFAHVGHTNVVAMTDMLNDMFGAAPDKKLFVGGCSAGGAGAIINYYFLRTGIDGVQKGYLLNDSGPIYPSQEPASRSFDFGALSRVLSDEFPNDRLAATHFRLDYNFSLYSYERFWTLDQDQMLTPYTGDGLGLDQDISTHRTGIHTAWWDDTALLRAQYDAPGRDNLGYFIPYWRQTNSSHCVTIPGLEENPPLLLLDNFAELAWDGTEIDTDDGEMTIHDYAVHLLSDEPLKSYFEEQGEGPYAPCARGADFDADACEAAVNPPG
ncbi:MAG: hypothetical protein JRF54_13550 [Deltaproteobacteria bacterium]|nr:hypothetical protein [Deltaproteobacteria bacterium]